MLKAQEIIAAVKGLSPRDFAELKLSLELEFSTAAENSMQERMMNCFPAKIKPIVESIVELESQTVKQLQKKVLENNTKDDVIGVDQVKSALGKLMLAEDDMAVMYAKVFVLFEMVASKSGDDDFVIRLLCQPLEKFSACLRDKARERLGIYNWLDDANSRIQVKINEIRKSQLCQEIEHDLEFNSSQISKYQNYLSSPSAWSEADIKKFTIELTNLKTHRVELIIKKNEYEAKAGIKDLLDQQDNQEKTILEQAEKFESVDYNQLIENIDLEYGNLAISNEKIGMLESACNEYKKHLQTVITKDLEKTNPDLVKNNKAPVSVATPATPAVTNNLDTLAEEIFTKKKEYPAMTEPCKVALEKYYVMKELQGALNQSQVKMSDKLINFKKIFSANRQYLEKRRDTETEHFLKIVATVFSLGIAAPWLWNVKGAEVAKNIDVTLFSPAKNRAAARIEETTALASSASAKPFLAS